MPIRLFEEKRPLYQMVAERLTAAIESGRHQVGSMLPTEAELCAQFNVSRQTVREATRLLLQAGLISRRPGVGTRVERTSLAEQYVQRLAKPADILRYVKETRRKMLHVADVRASQATVALPGDPAVTWRMLEALRFTADEKRPIAWTQIYVHPSYSEVSEEKDRDAYPVYSLIERRFGLKAMTVRQEISAVAIRASVAAHLHVKAKSPGLQVVRRYISTRDEEFEVAISIHPADRFQYTMQLDLAYATGLSPEAGAVVTSG